MVLFYRFILNLNFNSLKFQTMYFKPVVGSRNGRHCGVRCLEHRQHIGRQQKLR